MKIYETCDRRGRVEVSDVYGHSSGRAISWIFPLTRDLNGRNMVGGAVMKYDAAESVARAMVAIYDTQYRNGV